MNICAFNAVAFLLSLHTPGMALPFNAIKEVATDVDRVNVSILTVAVDDTHTKADAPTLQAAAMLSKETGLKLLKADGDLTPTNDSYKLSPEDKHKAFTTSREKAAAFATSKEKGAVNPKNPKKKKAPKCHGCTEAELSQKVAEREGSPLALTSQRGLRGLK